MMFCSFNSIFMHFENDKVLSFDLKRTKKKTRKLHLTLITCYEKVLFSQRQLFYTFYRFNLAEEFQKLQKTRVGFRGQLHSRVTKRHRHSHQRLRTLKEAAWTTAGVSSD